LDPLLALAPNAGPLPRGEIVLLVANCALGPVKRLGNPLIPLEEDRIADRDTTDLVRVWIILETDTLSNGGKPLPHIIGARTG
jgi:hypothetical protein